MGVVDAVGDDAAVRDGSHGTAGVCGGAPPTRAHAAAVAGRPWTVDVSIKSPGAASPTRGAHKGVPFAPSASRWLGGGVADSLLGDRVSAIIGPKN